MVTYLGVPQIEGTDEVTRETPGFRLDVWDGDYEHLGDGFVLANSEPIQPLFPRELLWMYVGEKLRPGYLQEQNVQQKLDSGQYEVWSIKGQSYLRRVFSIEGARVAPFGVSATGDRAFYQILNTGLVVSCCVQFHQAEQSVKQFQEAFGPVVNETEFYRKLAESLKQEIQRIRIESPRQYARYFGASESPPLTELGGAAFTPEGREWLWERFLIPYSHLSVILMLYGLSRLVDFTTLEHIKFQLLMFPIGQTSSKHAVELEPATSHRRALAQVVREGTPRYSGQTVPGGLFSVIPLTLWGPTWLPFTAMVLLILIAWKESRFAIMRKHLSSVLVGWGQAAGRSRRARFLSAA